MGGPDHPRAPPRAESLINAWDGTALPRGSDIPATPSLSVMYMPDRLTLYGAYMGAVQISRISSDEAEGTFAFLGRRTADDPQPLTVTDGSFNVPVGP